MGAEERQVRFYDRGQPLVLRGKSAYEGHRVLRRSEFLRYKVPVEAVTAFAGRQGPYNFEVFYMVEEDKGRAIYGFTYGKYDIEWPPYLLYRVDRSGKATRAKVW